MSTDNCERYSRKFIVSELPCQGKEPVGTFRETQGVEGLSHVLAHMGHGKEAAPYGHKEFASQLLFTSVAGVWPNCGKFALVCRLGDPHKKDPQSLYHSGSENKNIQELTNYKLARHVAAKNFSFKIGIDSVGLQRCKEIRSQC